MLSMIPRMSDPGPGNIISNGGRLLAFMVYCTSAEATRRASVRRVVAYAEIAEKVSRS